jgi:hypothetical protein
MSLKLNASGGGSVTLQEPSTASNFVLNLPAVTGTIATTENIPTPAALSTASGSAPSYSARAWVSFNGTGTPVIGGSGNVSSVTRNSTGNYTVNMTTAMPDANYSAVFSGQGENTSFARFTFLMGTKSTTAFTIGITSTNSVHVDSLSMSAAVFR